MTTCTRITLLFSLFLAIAGGARAQERTATAGTTATTKSDSEATTKATPATATSTEMATTKTTTAAPPEEPRQQSSQELRVEFDQVLRQYPSEVGSILAIDPTLLSDDAFLARYPELAEFVKAHPEVRHNPRYYLDRYEERPVQMGVFEQVIQPIIVLAGMALFLFAFSWVIRTYIEQKRWSRLATTQSEVHNRILERFGTSAELLDYVRTPAGTKFLESAPIPLHETPRATPSPFVRVIRSVQVGIVLAAGGLGSLFASARFTPQEGGPLFALGGIALFVGLGFVASAAVSIFLSKRLGLLQTNGSDEALAAAER